MLGWRAGSFKQLGLSLLSFLPTLVAMLLPPAVVIAFASEDGRGWQHLAERGWGFGLLLLALFMLYLIAFAISELFAHWRAAVAVATRPPAMPVVDEESGCE